MCIYKIDYDLDVKLRSIFDVEKKNTDEKQKEKEKAIKFGRETASKPRQGPREESSRIEATRPWYQLEKENDCFRCARAGRVNVDFWGDATTDFRASWLLPDVLIPRYPFTFELRPLLANR